MKGSEAPPECRFDQTGHCVEVLQRYTTATIAQLRGRGSRPGGKVAMEKWMCYGTLGVAAIMLIVFLMDLFVGVPFSGPAPESPFVVIDVFGVLASGVVGYLGYNALKDVK